MNREVHARFCERLGVKFPGPTHHQSDRPLWRTHVKGWESTGWCLDCESYAIQELADSKDGDSRIRVET